MVLKIWYDQTSCYFYIDNVTEVAIKENCALKKITEEEWKNIAEKDETNELVPEDFCGSSYIPWDLKKNEPACGCLIEQFAFDVEEVIKNSKDKDLIPIKILSYRIKTEPGWIEIFLNKEYTKNSYILNDKGNTIERI